MLTIPLYDDNPTTRPPVVTVLLIAACVLVFFWQQSLGARDEQLVVFGFGMVPAVLFGGASLPPSWPQVAAPLTLVTSMFLHGGWMHLLGNMLFLWIFGNNVEDRLGSIPFLLFYLVGGIAAALTQVFSTFAFGDNPYIPSLGASGAISGVLAGYLVLFPRKQVKVILFR